MSISARWLGILASSVIFFSGPVRLYGIDNLIQNGSFDSQGSWEKLNDGSLIVEEGIGQVTGKRENYASGIKQIVVVQPDVDYRISGRIRLMANDVKGAKIRVAWYKDNASSQLDTFDTELVTSTNWIGVKQDHISPQDASIAEIRLLVARKDTVNEARAYFDDITFSLAAISPNPSPEDNSSTIDNIDISEIYPSPDDGNEWVELFNRNNNSVNLDGWYLEDDGGNTRKINDFSIGANTYGVYKFSSGFLNNDGDTVKLLDNEKQIKSSLPDNYPKIERGYSWSKVNGNWCQTESSPKMSNKSCVNLDDSSDSSSDDSASPSPQVLGTGVVGKTNSQIIKKSVDSESMLDASASFSGEILGATRSSEKEEEDQEEEKQSLDWLIPLGLGGSGLLLLGAASFPLLKPKIIDLVKRYKP